MIIDTHSHIGNDFYCGNIKIQDYIQFCKKNKIDIGFLMPTPWPQYKDNNQYVTSLIWEHDNYIKKNYYSLINGNKVSIESNPYKNVNYNCFDEINKNHCSDIQLYFVPLIHGVLDNANYLEKMLGELNPKAVKMHGFGSGFSPTEIKSDIVEILKYYDIPIILHTSVYNYDYGYGADTKYWRNECHPYKWIEFLLKNNLKGVLNHGACLHNETIDLVNKSEKIMVALGPDLDISKDFFKVDIPKETYLKIEYLKYLKQKLVSTKILFDIDYNWNVDENNNIDNNSIQRVSETWSENELDNILYNNALEFFKLSHNEVKAKILKNTKN
ncbi:MAG: hypothetical protein IJO32_00290 [Bacilli bacterium]|nr:hypothetical protein [Bacilli bacterium]